MKQNSKNIGVGTSSKKLITGASTGERFIAFLDILGFKDRVARSNHKDILENLRKLTNFISECLPTDGSIMFTIFSDSIILYSNNNNKSQFITLTDVCKKTVAKSIELGFPIKGAISCGKFTALSSEKQLYFGQPLIDAYELEESIVIYGVAIHHTAESMVEQLKGKIKENFYDIEVPLKQGAPTKHHILNWYAIDYEKSKEQIKSIRRTVSNAPRRYIDNTLNIIKQITNE